jgi:hypothetical protein
MKMGVGVKKNGVKVLFVVLAIIGIAFVKNSEISNREDIVSTGSSPCTEGCPPVGIDNPPKKPKTQCPCLTPRLPKG